MLYTSFILNRINVLKSWFYLSGRWKNVIPRKNVSYKKRNKKNTFLFTVNQKSNLNLESIKPARYE